MRFIIYNNEYTVDEILAEEDRFMGEKWISEIINTTRQWYSSDTDLSVHTSGSTGTPKPIRLSKESMKASAQKTITYFGLAPEMYLHLCLPAAYIAGKMMVIRALVGEMNLICVPPSSAPLSGLTRGVNFGAMTPFQVHCALQEDVSNFDLVDTLIIGGAPVTPHLRKQLQSLQTKCYMTYGMTETITHIAVQNLNGSEASDSFELLEGVIISQQKGNLVIAADHLPDDKIITNDQVEILDSKRFRWIGRSDFVINSGGVKLHPESIETKLSDVVVEPYVVLGQYHRSLGHCAVLVIQGIPYDEKKQLALDSQMKLVLDRYEIPKKTYFVKELKTTATGKVLRDINLYELE